MSVHPAPSVTISPANGTRHVERHIVGPPPTLRTEISEFGTGAVSLRVRGDVDAGSLARLRTQLAHLLSRRPATLVLDVSEVSFLSARGLATLLEARDAASRAGVDLRLISGNRAVSRPLEVTGFDQLFSCGEDAAEPVPLPRAGD